METIGELLKIESDYIKKHASEPSSVYNEEYGEYVPTEVGDKLDFLKEGLFSKHYSALKGLPANNPIHNQIQLYGLNELEHLVLKCYTGFASHIFRIDSYYGKEPQLVKELCTILDRILDKAPMFDGDVLYRFCQEEDNVDFKLGEIFQPSYNLTTTIDDWGKKRNMYIIKPLKRGKTKARCIYKIYNHGEDCGAGENQVTFKVGAKFKIINIILDEKTDLKKIYMDEIE